MDKNSAEYERVKMEALLILCCCYDTCKFKGRGCFDPNDTCSNAENTNRILSIKGIAIEADDQSLSGDFSIAEFGLGDPLFDIDSIKEANFRKVV